VVRSCVSFSGQKPDTCFRSPRTIGRGIFDPHGQSACFVQIDAGQPPALRFSPAGLTVRFVSPVQEVFARLAFRAEVVMTAFNGATPVGSAKASGTSPAVLQLAAASITHVAFHSKDESPLLVEICVVKQLGQFCVYRGEFSLAPDEEIGMWSTYLFAQTRNDVALGTDPLIAATTIGGLPVTNNFTDGGGSDNITYGHSCLVDIVPNGQFQVVAPPVGTIG